jgi:hypothetical protein
MATGRAAPRAKAGSKGASARSRGVTFATVRRIALALPGVEEGVSFRTPAFKVGGKLVARLREDDDELVVRTRVREREAWLEKDPEAFFVTDHYLRYPAMLVRLSRVRKADLECLLRGAWEMTAPKRLRA